VVVPASLIKVRGKRVVISGHVPTSAEGSIAGPLGRVGAEVFPEEACQAARRSLLSILASLKDKVGNLEQIAAWGRTVACSCPRAGSTVSRWR
jgi:hypothetical protein